MSGAKGWKRATGRAVVAIMIVLASLASAASAGAATGWSSPTPIDPLMDAQAISCGASTLCAVIGGSNRSGLPRTTDATTFDGSAWSGPQLLDPQGTLSSVSCAGTSFCLAIDPNLSAWRFNGTSWTRTADLPSAGSTVSCASSTFCLVPDQGGYATFDGTAWTQHAAQSFSAQVLACVTSSFCVAISPSGVVSTYDGTAWANGATVDSVSPVVGLACPTTSFCAAADQQGDATTWSGSSWTAPLRIDSAGLSAIDCASSSFCMAVDGQGDESTYNGSSWSAPFQIDPGAALNGVSCPTSTKCLLADSAGIVIDDTGNPASAARAAIGGGGITGDSCPSASFCMAVDWNGRATSYNGTSWSTPAAIEPLGLGLAAVSCASPSFCVAVDEAGNALTYNGSGWGAGTQFDATGSPDAISCPTASFCVAVDQQGRAFIDNGGTWSGPYGVDPSRRLVAISCPTATFCMAADASGYVLTDTGGAWSVPQQVAVLDPPTALSCASPTTCVLGAQSQSFAYDGAAWHVAGTFGLSSVSCVSANFCDGLDGIGNEVVFDGNVFTATGQHPDSNPVTDDPVDPLIACASPAFCAIGDDDGFALTYAGAALPAAPSATAPPSINGFPAVGQTLTVTHGTWTNSPSSYSYQWEDCDAAGANCAAVAGANAATYTLGSGDLGHTVRVQEWAYNTGGTGGPQISAATAAVKPVSPPAATTIPAISGSPVVGQRLTSSQGSWSNAPTAFTYQWLYCPGTGTACYQIAGATGATYTVSAVFVGDRISVQVTAQNASGSGVAVGQPTAAVQAAPPRAPVDVLSPALAGVPQAGATLTASTGTWSGAGGGQLSYGFQWERCAASCQPIAAATGITYVPTAADVGAQLLVVVTAVSSKNGQSTSAQSNSPQVGPVAPARAVITKALRSLPAPRGRHTIPALLRAHAFAVTFAAPSPGQLIIDWYARTPGRNGRRVLVAQASVLYRSARKAGLRIVLTRAGRRLLAASRAVSVQSQAQFVPYGEKAARATATGQFTLRR